MAQQISHRCSIRLRQYNLTPADFRYDAGTVRVRLHPGNIEQRCTPRVSYHTSNLYVIIKVTSLNVALATFVDWNFNVKAT